MASFTILSPPALDEALRGLPGWRVEDGRLCRTFAFADFRQAFAFMTALAFEAEAANHHPEWSNVYNRVTIALRTHDAGDRITDLDARLAAAASALAARMAA